MNMTKVINLIGGTFGRLTVLSRDQNTKAGKARWKCRCFCGSLVSIVGSSLISGLTRSCGCLQKDIVSAARSIDLTGKRFDRLVVLSRVPSKRHRGQAVVYWKCMCDCGAQVCIRTASLCNGNTRSCGCLRKEPNSGHYALGDHKIDMAGRTFGWLTVLRENGRMSGGLGIKWLCRCRCGR